MSRLKLGVKGSQVQILSARLGSVWTHHGIGISVMGTASSGIAGSGMTPARMQSHRNCVGLSGVHRQVRITPVPTCTTVPG